jgi:predicted TIM-barrel fold metal-dependent hydrolase
MRKARCGMPFDDGELIDSHCHFGFHFTYVPYNTPDDIIRNMDRIGVTRACFCTLEVGMIGDHTIHNDRLADFANAHPDRISAYFTPALNYRERLLDDYIAYDKKGMSIGMKMHVYRQNFTINDDFLMPVFERINAKRGIVINHDFGSPDRLESVLRDFPDASFISGHPRHDYIPLMKRHDNIYICTCASTAYQDVRNMARKAGSERIVVGSDFVVLDTAFGFGSVVFAEITEQEKRNILGLNMKRLLARVIH